MYPKKNSTFVDRSAASSSPTPPVPAAAAVACWKRSNSCRSNLRSAVRESFRSCCCLASASTTEEAIGEVNGVKGVESMLPRPSIPGLTAYFPPPMEKEEKERILLASAADRPPRTWACWYCCWCCWCCGCRPWWWWWAALRLPRSWLGLLLLFRDRLAETRMLLGVDMNARYV